jgi:hypothetical protein
MDNGVRVVASINLPGLPLGTEARVDPGDPYVAECLEHGYLQRLPTRGDVGDEETVVEGGGETAEPDDPVGDAAADG